jgi:hypothetical protein
MPAASWQVPGRRSLLDDVDPVFGAAGVSFRLIQPPLYGVASAEEVREAIDMAIEIGHMNAAIFGQMGDLGE